MRLPWTKATENYQDSSYTDALIAALIRQVKGRTAGTALTSETGALESAAGLVGRAFMACEVVGDPMYTQALTPQVMELVGRSLIRRGDAVFYLDTSAGLKHFTVSDPLHRRRAYAVFVDLRCLPGRTWPAKDAAARSSGWRASLPVWMRC